MRREVKGRPTEVTADVNAPAARGLAGLPRAAILARGALLFPRSALRDPQRVQSVVRVAAVALPPLRG